MHLTHEEAARRTSDARGQQPQPLRLRASGLEFSALELGEGPAVLCLHGFPDHARTFRLLQPALAGAGYRAIAPTLRGYEPSSQPRRGGYHVSQLAEDVLGWMDDLGLRKAHLIGHDWGAIIGYAAAALAPERFHSLATLAVPHPVGVLKGFATHPAQLRNSWYMFFFQLRLLPDATLPWNDFQLIERLWRDWSPGWQWPDEEMRALKHTLRQPGVARAALGYYRDFFKLWSPHNWSTQRLLFSPVGVPTLALTGERDGCIDTRLFDTINRASFPRGLWVERLAQAGHFLHQERPEEVHRLLLEWLARHPE